MRLFDLLRGHFLDHLFLRNRRVRIAADRAEHVPHISARQVRCRHPQTDLIVPAHPALGARMAFHRTAQIPVEGPDVILLDAQPQRIHHPDQLFCIGIARARGGPKLLHRFFKATLLHKIAALFDLGQHRKRHQTEGDCKFKHLIILLFLISRPAVAGPLSDADFHPADPLQAELGQLLFYDKILSGNRNISCGTCHHHAFHGTDGLSLGIGEGGEGVGPKRTAGTDDDRIRKRIPRNAPALWNLGHRDVSVLFHDGRLSVSEDYGNGFNSPAEEWLPSGLDTILAAQVLFPLTAQFEMAGNPKENEVAGAVHDRIDAAWPIIAKRVRVIPEYGERFVAAFDHIRAPEDVTIVEIANALGAFINAEWRSFDSAYDAFLAGRPLPDAAEAGRRLFFGKAGCAECHRGPLFTDQGFHALALPAFGPGRTRRFDPIPRDVGRMGESDALEDAYRFRTPSLRNVALTAPYGHNGAYPTLEGMVHHHLAPLERRTEWTRATAALPIAQWLEEIDFVIQSDTREMARQAAKVDIAPRDLSDAQVAELVAFLHSLTGATAQQRPLGRPDTVPSGLPVD